MDQLSLPRLPRRRRRHDGADSGNAARCTDPAGVAARTLAGISFEAEKTDSLKTCRKSYIPIQFKNAAAYPAAFFDAVKNKIIGCILDKK